MSANRRSFHLRNRIIIAPYDRNPRRLRRIVSGLLEIEGPADITRSFLSPITPIIRQIEGLSVRGDPGVNSEEQIEAPDTSLLDWDFSPAPETPFRPRQTLSSTRMVFGTPITTTAIGISTTASATTSTNPLNSGTPETPEIPTLPSRNAHDINFRPIVFTSGSFTFTPSAPVTAICTSIVNLTTLSTNTTTSISPPASNTTTETTSTFTANRPIPTIEISPSSNLESEQQLTNTMSIPSGSTAPRASFDVLFSSLPELKCESHSINQFIFVCDLIYDEYFKSDDFSRDRYYIRLLALKIPQEIFGRLGGMAYDRYEDFREALRTVTVKIGFASFDKLRVRAKLHVLADDGLPFDGIIGRDLLFHLDALICMREKYVFFRAIKELVLFIKGDSRNNEIECEIDDDKPTNTTTEVHIRSDNGREREVQTREEHVNRADHNIERGIENEFLDIGQGPVGESFVNNVHNEEDAQEVSNNVGDNSSQISSFVLETVLEEYDLYTIQEVHSDVGDPEDRTNRILRDVRVGGSLNDGQLAHPVAVETSSAAVDHQPPSSKCRRFSEFNNHPSRHSSAKVYTVRHQGSLITSALNPNAPNMQR
ncbi:hypothetical protein DMENIID0001_075900 [Sergentomyia squamirostris]